MERRSWVAVQDVFDELEEAETDRLYRALTSRPHAVPSPEEAGIRDRQEQPAAAARQ